MLRVRGSAGVAVQGLRAVPGAGSGATRAGGALSPRTLADAGRARPSWRRCPAASAAISGPELRRFVLMQYHQGQVTVERLVAQLQAIGVSISKRQVMRLLIDGQDAFLAETREVLRAGLATADWVTVDDTGARHAAQRRLHADRQRQFRLVRHDRQQEPAELPRSAARRPHRLRDQRCRSGLYA